MIETKYYIKVASVDVPIFEKYLSGHNTKYTHLSTDWTVSDTTHLYSVIMDRQEAVSLKLSIPLAGCINFLNTLDKIKQNSRQITGTVLK